MPAAPESTAVAPSPSAPSGGDVPIPQISSMTTGAQAVKPAPAGTIPSKLQPFSQRPDSAMSKLKERLRGGKTGQQDKPAAQPAQQNKGGEPVAEPAEQQKKPDAAATPPAADDADEEDLMGAKIGEDEKAEKPPEGDKKDEAAPSTDDKDKKAKVNPWKLLEEQKSARAALEKEVADVRKLVPNAEQRKAELAELEQVKKRNEELEKHIQFVDYQQSKEFKEKYEEPYKNQWKTSMTELKGVMAETEVGERDLTAQDLLDLVNMPKTKARQVANDMFGDFANDVMNERDKIRAAYDAQNKALEEAKTNGVTKAQQAQQQNREAYQKLNTEVSEIYSKAVDTISRDTKTNQFITPKEGDAKHNELLTRGLEMVDEAFKINPMDPSLTPKQRESAVKKHAAVRFRSAGYGPLKHAYAQLESKYKAVAARLAEYEGTVPNRGGSETQSTTTPSAGGGAMARMQARLRARAK